MKVSPIRVGVVLGVVMGIWHAGWAALVAIGWAQTLIDFILYIHFIKLPLTVETFELTRACLLMGVTSLLGFALGIVAGLTWNAFHSQQAQA